MRRDKLSQKERQELLKRQNYTIEMQQKKDFHILTFKLDLVREIVLKVVDKTRNPLKRLVPKDIAEYAVKIVNETFDKLAEDPEEEEEQKQEAASTPAPVSVPAPVSSTSEDEEPEKEEDEDEEVEILDLGDESKPPGPPDPPVPPFDRVG